MLERQCLFVTGSECVRNKNGHTRESQSEALEPESQHLGTEPLAVRGNMTTSKLFYDVAELSRYTNLYGNSSGLLLLARRLHGPLQLNSRGCRIQLQHLARSNKQRQRDNRGRAGLEGLQSAPACFIHIPLLRAAPGRYGTNYFKISHDWKTTAELLGRWGGGGRIIHYLIYKFLGGCQLAHLLWERVFYLCFNILYGKTKDLQRL